jgi:NADH-quinone oxidoreductase subunit L
LIIAVFGRQLKGFSHWPCILGCIGSCICSFIVYFAVRDLAPVHESVKDGTATVLEVHAPWIQAGKLNIPFALRADGLTSVMLLTVTFVGSLIAIFAIGYMHGDPGYPRFFAEISLFLFSMTGLVLADNFIVLYAFWEGVGLCSYLLIGFWFSKPSAAAAARKAFLVTRLGDVGFLLGIILLWVLSGYDLSYEAVFAHPSSFDSDLRLTACLLLFCGAVGKSAQFPLYVWLPDAMEGPTPVSALIHAATMVTAGVYLVARCTPLFVLEPASQIIVAAIGGITALLAALIALTQTDLKRVLAYSTISQLGYMFIALGSGAVVAGIFHLVTHAFFKALLFLAAGSVMHAMGNVIDMRRFGGLRHVLKITHATFLCGAAALAGFPVLSGFWSKDEILDGCFQAWEHRTQYGNVYFLLLVIGLLTAGLTAFYTFRAYFLTFWGDERIPPEAGHHAHESPPVMTIPLIVLAVGAVGAGILIEPFTHWLSAFMGGHTAGIETHGPEAMNYPLMVVSTILALGGIGVAWLMYVKQTGLAGRLASQAQILYQMSLNKFHVDEIYEAMILKPLAGFTAFCRMFDLNILDGIVDLVGQLPRLLGGVFRPVQNGLVQFYALAMILGLTVFLLALIK